MQWNGIDLHSTNLYELAEKLSGHLTKDSKLPMIGSSSWKQIGTPSIYHKSRIVQNYPLASLMSTLEMNSSE